MNLSYSIKLLVSKIGRVVITALILVHSAFAQSLLFDFDNAPPSTSLPISQTVGGVTAYFSATGQGFSIQNANVLGFTPQGFSGQVIYPNSIYLADLLIRFNQPLTDFSIMYSCQELGCDDAATMRVTAYMNGALIGTNTKTAGIPGTWPVDTLSCSFTQGFDSLIIHYDSPPPTCQDYGVIFMADNMLITPLNTTSILNHEMIVNELFIQNPVSESSSISFSLLRSGNIHINIYDMTGRLVKNLFYGNLTTGKHMVKWNVNVEDLNYGLYFLNIGSEDYSQSFKITVIN